MQNDIIRQLKTLRSIEPEAAWKESAKGKLMEKVSVFGAAEGVFSIREMEIKPKFDIRALFPSRMAVTFTSMVVVLASGILTVGASQSSLPGDPLYSVKKASEQVKLAVASEQDKPKIEIELAGKRLQELEEISRNGSDSDQHQKVKDLVAEFEAKVNSANTHLTELNEKGKTDTSVKVADVAKVVNEQSEKYSEVLQKTAASLPTAVQEQVKEEVAGATITTQKTNLAALLVIVESPEEQNSEEIAAKVQKTVENAENQLNVISEAAPQASTCTIVENPETACQVQENAASNVGMTEEAKIELEKAKESLKNNNLADTLKSVATVTEIASKVDSTAAASAVITTTAPENADTSAENAATDAAAGADATQ